MPDGASIEGREVPLTDADAQRAGFENARALKYFQWQLEQFAPSEGKNQVTLAIVKELANLREQVRALQSSCSYTESMTRPIGSA